MKKSIIFVLVVVTAMVLSMGLLTCSISAEPAQPQTQVEQAPAQPVQKVPETLMDTKINIDGSALTTYTMEVDPSLIEKMPNFVETISKQVEKSGYTVELIDKDGKKALLLTKAIKSGEKLTFAPPGQDTEDFDFVTIKGFFSTMYIASARFDMRGYPESQELMKFSFHAPIKPKYSNAEVQEKGGMANTWSIKGGSANPINFIIEVPNVINIIIVLLIILILAFVIFMVVLSNKKKANQGLVDLSEEEYEVDEAEDPFKEMTEEEINEDIKEDDK